MSLDITKVAGQVSLMAEKMKANAAVQRQHLAAAQAALDGEVKLDNLREKVRRSKTSFLLADPTEDINCKMPATAPPETSSVTASDGSHIDFDRHRPTPCRLINIGTVRLDYGADSGADLDSYPVLLSEDRDLFIRDPQSSRETPLQGALLGIKRDVEEFRALADLSAALPSGRPALALSDGSLIRWSLTTQNYDAYVLRELLDNGYIKCLDEFKNLCEKQPLAMASYISRPGGEEVVNTLRLLLCPYEPANCDRHCAALAPGGRPCDAVSGIADAELFAGHLAAGERSGIFESTSKVIGQYYGPHHICFFYLRLEDEIARIELPSWLAADSQKVKLIHSLTLEQVKKGGGYPVALAEAHELAVVTGADREVFFELVDSYLAEQGITSAISAKSFSKQARWL